MRKMNEKNSRSMYRICGIAFVFDGRNKCRNDQTVVCRLKRWNFTEQRSILAEILKKQIKLSIFP